MQRKHQPRHPLRHPRLGYWPLIWVIIYTLILIVGVFKQKGTLITVIKLGGVLLCSIYSIRAFPKDYLLQLAMMTTFVADCLLACDNTSVIGLMVFFIAQILHLYRLVHPKCYSYVFIFAVIGLFIMACANLTNLVPPIYIVVAFYTCVLSANVLITYSWQKVPTAKSLRQIRFCRFRPLRLLRPLYCTLLSLTYSRPAHPLLHPRQFHRLAFLLPIADFRVKQFKVCYNRCKGR